MKLGQDKGALIFFRCRKVVSISYFFSRSRIYNTYLALSELALLSNVSYKVEILRISDSPTLSNFANSFLLLSQFWSGFGFQQDKLIRKEGIKPRQTLKQIKIELPQSKWPFLNFPDIILSPNKF